MRTFILQSYDCLSFGWQLHPCLILLLWSSIVEPLEAEIFSTVYMNFYSFQKKSFAQPLTVKALNLFCIVLKDVVGSSWLIQDIWLLFMLYEGKPLEEPCHLTLFLVYSKLHAYQNNFQFEIEIILEKKIYHFSISLA